MMVEELHFYHGHIDVKCTNSRLMESGGHLGTYLLRGNIDEETILSYVSPHGIKHKLIPHRRTNILYKNNPTFEGITCVIDFLIKDSNDLSMPVSRPSVCNDHDYTTKFDDSNESHIDHSYFSKQENSNEDKIKTCKICENKVETKAMVYHMKTHNIFYCFKECLHKNFLTPSQLTLLFP